MTNYSPKIFPGESYLEYGIAVSREEFLLDHRPFAGMSEEEHLALYSDDDSDMIVVNRDHSLKKIKKRAEHYDNPVIVYRWIRASTFRELTNED